MAETIIKGGKLLVAEPYMLDPYFKRAVVLICDHHANSSLGFILNKKLDVRLNDLLSNFPEFTTDVFYGGPVQTDTLHFIHNVGDLLEGSFQVCDGIFWGGHFEKLKFLITSKLITPANVRFFVGYSGWSEGQLQEEMKDGSWVVADMDPNFLFKYKYEKLWQKVMEDIGSTHAILAQVPSDLIFWN